MIVELFTEGWLAGLDRAAEADAGLAAACAGLELVVNHTITGGPGSDVEYHVSFSGGTVRFRPGLSPGASVALRQDRATAEGLATGTLSAQHAFMTGRLRVSGDLALLARSNRALGGLAGRSA